MTFISRNCYLNQTGQLRTMGRNNYGDTVVTTITTVKCLVYVERDQQRQTNPAISNPTAHQVILPTEVRATITTNDHLSNVVDPFGRVVLADARIQEIIDYNHWNKKVEVFQCQLDLELDGA